MIKSFSDIYDVIARKPRSKLGVVMPTDENTLESIEMVLNKGWVEVILIGPEKIIKEQIKRNKYYDNATFYNAKDDNDAAYLALELVHSGKIDLMMKGKIKSGDLLKAALDKKNGIKKGKLLNHIVIFEIPGWHKLLIISDSGMVLTPDLQQKKEIIRNTVEFSKYMDIDVPKIAILSAVEYKDEKIPSTIDAVELVELSKKGEFGDVIIEGPMDLSCAVDPEAARIKGRESKITGDVDIFIMPEMVGGNILGKALMHFAKAHAGGVVVGGKVPIVLLSRASNAREKLNSLSLGLLAVNHTPIA